MGDAKVIYQGPKVFWKTKVTLEVSIVEHFIFGVLEIACYDSVLKVEAPRLFINDNVLQSKIDAIIVERLKDLEKEKIRLKGETVDEQAVATKALRQARVEYILDRLFIKDYSAKERKVTVELQFNFHDRENDSVTTVASMVATKPSGLQSYKVIPCVSPTSAKFAGGAPDRASTSPNRSAPTSAVPSPRESSPRNPHVSFLASNAHLRARSLVPAATFSSSGNLEIGKADNSQKANQSGKVENNESTPPSRRRPPQSQGRRTAQADVAGQGAFAGEVGSADNSSEAALIDSLAKRFTRSLSSFRSSFQLGSSQRPERRESSGGMSKRPSFLRRLSYSLGFGSADYSNDTSKTLSSLLSAHADLGEPVTENVTRVNSDYMEAIKQRAQEDAASAAAAKEQANTAAEGRSLLGPLRRSLMFMSAGVSALSPTSASAATTTGSAAPSAGPRLTPRQGQPLSATTTFNPPVVSGRPKHGSFAVLVNTPKASARTDGQLTPKQSSAGNTARDAKESPNSSSKPSPLQQPGTLGRVFTYMVGGSGSSSNRIVPAN